MYSSPAEYREGTCPGHGFPLKKKGINVQDLDDEDSRVEELGWRPGHAGATAVTGSKMHPRGWDLQANSPMWHKSHCTGNCDNWDEAETNLRSEPSAGTDIFSQFFFLRESNSRRTKIIIVHAHRQFPCRQYIIIVPHISSKNHTENSLHFHK